MRQRQQQYVNKLYRRSAAAQVVIFNKYLRSCINIISHINISQCRQFPITVSASTSLLSQGSTRPTFGQVGSLALIQSKQTKPQQAGLGVDTIRKIEALRSELAGVKASAVDDTLAKTKMRVRERESVQLQVPTTPEPTSAVSSVDRSQNVVSEPEVTISVSSALASLMEGRPLTKSLNEKYDSALYGGRDHPEGESESRAVSFAVSDTLAYHTPPPQSLFPHQTQNRSAEAASSSSSPSSKEKRQNLELSPVVVVRGYQDVRSEVARRNREMAHVSQQISPPPMDLQSLGAGRTRLSDSVESDARTLAAKQLLQYQPVLQPRKVVAPSKNARVLPLTNKEPAQTVRRGRDHEEDLFERLPTAESTNTALSLGSYTDAWLESSEADLE